LGLDTVRIEDLASRSGINGERNMKRVILDNRGCKGVETLSIILDPPLIPIIQFQWIISLSSAEAVSPRSMLGNNGAELVNV
jgi:hypothetical protein